MERFKKILINSAHSIKQILRHMDSVGEKTIFILDHQKHLLGTVTDGDIRRWILKGKSLNDNITKIMNRKPTILRDSFSRDDACKIILEHGIECIPVLNSANDVISAVWWKDLFQDEPFKKGKFNLPVVVMAGGEGTRLSPFTKILPKPLMPLGDKPIIEIIINKFYEYGCKKFYLSVNYKSNIIKAYFNDIEHKYSIDYIQEAKPLGTAGSLHLLKKKIRHAFFISNCDILIDADYSDILRFHKENKNKITLVSSMKNFKIPYGVCRIENGGVLKSIEEKPEYDFLVNTGMYILEPEVLNDIPKNKVYNITDLIGKYLFKNEKVGVYPVSEKSWIDLGQIEVLQEAIKNIGAV